MSAAYATAVPTLKMYRIPHDRVQIELGDNYQVLNKGNQMIEGNTRFKQCLRLSAIAMMTNRTKEEQ